jgi:hypothetical protein
MMTWLSCCTKTNANCTAIIFAKDQEIRVLKDAIGYCNAELDRLEKEHARGL